MNYTGNHVADGEIEDSRQECEHCHSKNDRLHTINNKEICLQCYAEWNAVHYQSSYYKGYGTIKDTKYICFIEESNPKFDLQKNIVIILSLDETFCYEYRISSKGILCYPEKETFEYYQHRFLIDPCTEQDFIDAERKAQRLLDIIE